MAENNNIDPDRMRDVIDKASQHARMIYYLYLGFISYCAVTVFSTTDRQLVLKGHTTELPILGVSVPLEGFFIVAPLLCIGLFVYFMLYLYRLNTLVGELDKYCRNPLNKHNFNRRELYPWMINIARDPEPGLIGLLQKLIVGLTLWFTLPTTLFIFAFKFAKKHDEIFSYMLSGITFTSIFLVILFYQQLNPQRYINKLQNTLTGISLVVVLTASFFVTFMIIPRINDGDFKWANLDLRNEILVAVPKESEQFEQGYWVDLEGVNLNGANLSNSVLKRGNLRGAKLKNANLTGANLHRADMAFIHVYKEDGPDKLIITDLQETVFLRADLRGADLRKADLQWADFNGANLQGSDLRGADLQWARLINSDIRNAKLGNFYTLKVINSVYEFNLNWGKLENANFGNSNLQETDLSGVNLRRAVFFGAKLQKVDFGKSSLQGADLGEAELEGTGLYKADLINAENLTKEQICQAGTLWDAKINEDLLKEIEGDGGCHDKLKEESYKKWLEEREKRNTKEQQANEEKAEE